MIILALSCDDPNYNKSWKVCPIIDTIQPQACAMYVPEPKVSIDESMIGTKAQLSFLQYRGCEGVGMY